MKRLESSDSMGMGAIISMCPTTEEHCNNHHIYNTREYHSMLEGGFDEEGSMEDLGHAPEKKRRLSLTQVKALEKSFDLENKLEPDRKLKLAQQLGLQSRQVAVWFQNRRARWKTKQLERDYGLLKSNFDHLKHNCDSLQRDKDALLNEIKELKSKLEEEEKVESIKEEANSKDKVLGHVTPPASLSEDANLDAIKGKKSVELYKDGQCDSDSSAILNDDHTSNSSSGFLQNQHHISSMPLRFNSCDSSSSVSPSSKINNNNNNNNNNNVYHPQFVKMEEHNFFGGEEEACDFFSDEQAPTLQWCWT